MLIIFALTGATHVYDFVLEQMQKIECNGCMSQDERSLFAQILQHKVVCKTTVSLLEP